MYLQVNDTRIDVAGCLKNVCTLRNPINLKPCEADFVIIIDEQQEQIIILFFIKFIYVI